MELTQEYIESLPAGDALDQLVNEYVYGYKRFNINGGKMNLLVAPSSVEAWRTLWPDIAEGWIDGVKSCATDYGVSLSLDAAWRVVEHMKAVDEADGVGPWWWNFWHGGRQPRLWEQSAQEAAAAICRAAVIAMLPQPGLVETFKNLSQYFKDVEFLRD